MILTTADYARAEDGYLREPEPDTRCDGCGHSPCSCDQEYEAYRGRWLDDHYDYVGAE